MANSLTSINNVGVKFKYQYGNAGQGTAGYVFLTEDLAAVLVPSGTPIASDPLNIQQTVRAHLRKQYPGDTTTISVKSHDRVRSVGGNAFENTLPGRSAYFGVVKDGPPREQKEIQFQFTGSFANLLAHLRSVVAAPGAEEEYYLRSPNGVPKVLHVPGGT